MSGLSRTPGKRVWVNSPTRVRIPPSPPFCKVQRAVRSQAWRRCAMTAIVLRYFARTYFAYDVPPADAVAFTLISSSPLIL